MLAHVILFRGHGLAEWIGAASLRRLPVLLVAFGLAGICMSSGSVANDGGHCRSLQHQTRNGFEGPHIVGYANKCGSGCRSENDC